jgi:hypothetical protein
MGGQATQTMTGQWADAKLWQNAGREGESLKVVCTQLEPQDTELLGFRSVSVRGHQGGVPPLCPDTPSPVPCTGPGLFTKAAALPGDRPWGRGPKVGGCGGAQRRTCWRREVGP